MNKIVSLLLLLSSFHLLTAQKYITKTGNIKFTSHTPVEDIKAENRKVVSVLDSKTGDLQFQLLMKGFDFPNDLMEQHFNESYAESDKYDKASFKGKITDMSKVDFTKDGTYTVDYTGKLTIKDVTKDISGTATIVVKGGVAKATSTLKIKPKDYNFTIPAAVASKIAETVEVEIVMDYKKK